uniref:Uncharacterized protein n=1 Tax=Trichogramma kaykai TaxID=54128 RepID=A0ABD2WI64_9HYME
MCGAILSAARCLPYDGEAARWSARLSMFVELTCRGGKARSQERLARRSVMLVASVRLHRNEQLGENGVRGKRRARWPLLVVTVTQPAHVVEAMTHRVAGADARARVPLSRVADADARPGDDAPRGRCRCAGVCPYLGSLGAPASVPTEVSCNKYNCVIGSWLHETRLASRRTRYQNHSKNDYEKLCEKIV